MRHLGDITKIHGGEIEEIPIAVTKRRFGED